MSTVLGQSVSSERIAIPDSEESLAIHWAVATHVGLVRKVNEDSLLADFPIFGVCDGMGGHASGDVASKIVVTELSELFGQPCTNPKEIYQALVRAETAVDALTGDAEFAGAGTTVTGLAVTLEEQQPFWFVFNIGDSRVYRLFEGEFDQVTIDHSLVQEMVDNGFLGADEAEGHPDSNVITRAIGFQSDPLPDGWKIPMNVGERYLICSDGLTKELDNLEIATLLARAETPEAAANDLVNAAVSNGGRDNVTVVVVETQKAE